MKLPVTILLSEFFFFQCIGNRKLRGLARPLNFIQSCYNFAGFIRMSKRNLKSVGQSYLRTFIFLGHTSIDPGSIWSSSKVSFQSPFSSLLSHFSPSSAILRSAGTLCFPRQDLHGSIDILCIHWSLFQWHS